MNNNNPNALDTDQVRNKTWDEAVQRATVLDVFPDAHAIRVNVRGEDNPIVCPVLSPNYGSVLLPSVGSRVTLLYITENTPVAIGNVYLADKQSPPSADIGDVVLGNDSGSSVTINNDGSIDITTADRQPVNIDFQTATVYLNNDQDVAAGDTSIVQYDTIEQDTESLFDAANHAYVVRHSGLYEIRGAIEIESAGQNNLYQLAIYTNETLTHRITKQSTVNAPMSLSVSEMVQLEEGDEIDIRLFNDSGQTRTIAGNQETNTFDIQRVGI